MSSVSRFRCVLDKVRCCVRYTMPRARQQLKLGDRVAMQCFARKKKQTLFDWRRLSELSLGVDCDCAKTFGLLLLG